MPGVPSSNEKRIGQTGASTAVYRQPKRRTWVIKLSHLRVGQYERLMRFLSDGAETERGLTSQSTHHNSFCERILTSSSAIAEGPHDTLSQLKSCQLLHNCTKNHI